MTKLRTFLGAMAMLFAALGFTGSSALAAGPAPSALKGLQSNSTADALVQKMHGRHCGWRRGHRHRWACGRVHRRWRSRRWAHRRWRSRRWGWHRRWHSRRWYHHRRWRSRRW